jgi:hypothetical protein
VATSSNSSQMLLTAADADADADADDVENVPTSEASEVSKLHQLFENISKHALKNTLTIVLVQRPISEALRLSKQRKACSNIRSSAVWTSEQERSYKTCLKRLHEGRVFVSLKT